MRLENGNPNKGEVVFFVGSSESELIVDFEVELKRFKFVNRFMRLRMLRGKGV